MTHYAKAAVLQPDAMARTVMMFVFAVAIYLQTTSLVYAAINTPMGVVLCQIVYMLYGNLGRGLATLAVLVLGVGATLGKVTWGLAITVAVGISVIFNASLIVGLLGVGAGC